MELQNGNLKLLNNYLIFDLDLLDPEKATACALTTVLSYICLFWKFVCFGRVLEHSIV